MTENIREQLKSQLTRYVESITERSKGANMYICPLCHSGSGRSRTGAFSIYQEGTRWKCFSCGKEGDIFDLIGEHENIPDYTEQARRAGELCNISTYDYIAPTKEHTQPHIHNSSYTITQPQTDYTDFFLKAHERIQETDYPQQRGLTEETIARFKLGFVAEWKIPLDVYLKGGQTSTGKPRTKESWEYIPTSPRLIIPTSPYSYLARDTRTDIPEEQRAYSKSKVGSIQLFNKRALQTATKPIFIVEGELDALSIIEVGGEAVALGTTTKSKAFLELVKAQAPAQPLIIALDNDGAGERASIELIEGLKELNIPAYRFNPCGEYKDASEALQRDRETFAGAVAEAEQIQDEAEQAQRENYLKNSVANHLQSFVEGIGDSVNTRYIPTGFNKLDETLDGGLYEGLYIVGAISSLGKTTLVTQIADQIAQSGQDVLIFSLEMARTELMAKSISRHTIQSVLANGGDISHAKTARGITTGTRYKNYNETENALIGEAIITYSKYAEHIYISEGIGDIGVNQIRETIAQHILFTGNTPVVVIDYLQILAPYSERATDKQNTDKAVMELKRISRDYKLPLIGISSFNRASYKEAVTMEAFKESGAIEYSSDVLIGLQLKGAGGNSFDANEAKRKNPREIELVILKNRNGRTGDKLGFNFYPMFNYFAEL